jgi:hypothetical protein
VNLAFSQPAFGFDLSKVQVSSNARVSGLLGGGQLYQFGVTAWPTVADYGKSMNHTITIPAGGAVGADGIPLATLVTFPIQTPTITGPTAVMTSDATHDYWSNSRIKVAIQFSEPVTSFTAGSLRAVNGSIDGPSLLQDSTDPTRYTFDLVPDGSGKTAQVILDPGGIVGQSGHALMYDPQVLAFQRNIVSVPVVTSITSSFSGVAKPGDLIPIEVNFSGPVIVDTSKSLPIVILDASGPAGKAVATYVSGGSADKTSSTLTFNYVVQPGQRVGRLDYDSAQSLTSLGQVSLVSGTIKDAATVAPLVNLILFDPGSKNSLGGSTNIPVGASTTGVTQVSSTLADGTYGVGQTIPITLKFNAPVTVDTSGGTPTLALATAGGGVVATYSGGSGTDTLTFTFTTSKGLTTSALDYTSPQALNPAGGKILDASTGFPVDPTLPAPGSVGSLSRSRVLAIVDHPARVLAVWDDQTNATVGVTGVVKIFVGFDIPVTVDTTGGSPTLSLQLDGNRTATASYVGGSGSYSTSLEFDYTVAKGDESLKLDYTSTSALSPSAKITDILGQNAVKTFPAPGGAGSLRSNNTTVAGAPPRVLAVTALTSNNGFGLNGSNVVDGTIWIQVTMSRLVNVDKTKGTPTLALNASGTAVAVFDSLVDKTLPILNFKYLVQPGDSTAHLDYTSTTALNANGGSITDQSFGNVPADLTLPAPGSPASLAGSSSLAVQTSTTAVPTVANLASPAVNGTYVLGAKIPIVVNLSYRVDVTSTTQLQLTLDNGQTALADYQSGSGTNTLNFLYTVAQGQDAARLDDGGFLVLNGSTNLPLPAAGSPGSLGRNSRIAINTAPAAQPVVLFVSAAVPDGQYRTGNIIPIQVHFSRPVQVTGTPQLALLSGSCQSAVANFASGSGTDTLTFNYTVAASQRSSRLDYLNASALSTPSGSNIVDALNLQPASRMLPGPGLAGSLSQESLLVINNPQAPTLVLPGPDAPVVSSFTFLAAPGITQQLRASAATSGTPATDGFVQFLINGLTVGEAPVSQGTATLSLSSPLPAGMYAVTALYVSADGTQTSSISTPATLEVDAFSVDATGVQATRPDGTRLYRIEPFGSRFHGGLNVVDVDRGAGVDPELVITPQGHHRPTITLYDGTTGKKISSFLAYDPAYRSGVPVTAVVFDGRTEVIAGSGPGAPPRVRVFDGVTGKILNRFRPFADRHRRGVSVALGQPPTSSGYQAVARTPSASGLLTRVLNVVRGAGHHQKAIGLNRPLHTRRAR